MVRTGNPACPSHSLSINCAAIPAHAESGVTDSGDHICPSAIHPHDPMGVNAGGAKCDRRIRDARFRVRGISGSN